jgi:hypothetical protein
MCKSGISFLSLYIAVFILGVHIKSLSFIYIDIFIFVCIYIWLTYSITIIICYKYYIFLKPTYDDVSITQLKTNKIING